MMYKNVLTHQPNLVDPYELGRWVTRMLLAYLICRVRLIIMIVIRRHILGGHQGPTDKDPTSHRPPHGASGSPLYLGPDSPQKAVTGSAHKQALGSPQVPVWT
jgi:hypothetical protein